MQFYIGMCKQNGGTESRRAGGSLESRGEQRQEGGALGYLEGVKENQFPRVHLVWQKDPQGETKGLRNSVCFGYLPPSTHPSLTKKSLGWILFPFSFTKRAVSITGREKQRRNLAQLLHQVTIIMGNHPESHLE